MCTITGWMLQGMARSFAHAALVPCYRNHLGTNAVMRIMANLKGDAIILAQGMHRRMQYTAYHTAPADTLCIMHTCCRLYCTYLPRA